MAHHLKYGDFLEAGDLPAAAVADCSHQGTCDNDVEFWQRELDFTVDRDSAIKYLRQTGGWDAEELAVADDVTLAQRVLWLACGDLRDGEDALFCMEG